MDIMEFKIVKEKNLNVFKLVEKHSGKTLITNQDYELVSEIFNNIKNNGSFDFFFPDFIFER